MKLYDRVKNWLVQHWAPWLWRIPLLLLLTLCLWLLIFRWVPVPTSAFMLRQDITAVFSKETPFVRHDWVSLEEIPRHMQLAVIASEDQRFSEHWGIDVQATEAAIQAELKGRGKGGGSTITQQLAKNLFLWEERSYLRKGLEWGIAGLIEIFWSKERILEVYLNTAQFSKADYGVGAAAQNLLKKPVGKLGKADAALLAAVLPSPRTYSVTKPSSYVRARQGRIQRQMRSIGGAAYLQRLD
ncbi:MAG: monofunctional biosynthetic peptidoglycan transglycosylase [Gammaproteobacteria bacterium]|nr:monofunctional biosynthetic peptidoglycan transglycosylase [Gammaproteobacteria bacterium]MBU1723164.1 monofunctional biosynthetic peptidoglycan transglycosylase [Gammaproteobacteria bacterium]MBU2005407.1 monofunctional biosynthetic peptidoglycan transglycosylase [Gammaproteobacteria bacterium]